MKRQNVIPLIIIALIFASIFRFMGINWDQGQHLHPDERFLTMVTNALVWPSSLHEYLDATTSPLNPHNKGFGFYVYGTFPVFFTKIIADILGKNDYANLTIIGRNLSAGVDLGTAILVGLIGLQLIRPAGRLFKIQIISGKLSGSTVPVLALFFYSISVLSIQLSHFYAVDIYLTFFLTLTFFLGNTLIKRKMSDLPDLKDILLVSVMGISYGLGLASKISGIYFLPITLLFIFYRALLFSKNSGRIKKLFDLGYSLLLLGFIFASFTYLTFRLAQPYAFATPDILDFTLNPKLLENWQQLQLFSKPSPGFPPSIQWFHIKPLLFPFASLMLWGLGLPLGILAFAGTIFIFFLSVFRYFKLFINGKASLFSPETYLPDQASFAVLVSIFWILLLFFYEGLSSNPSIRYFHQIYPFLSIVAAIFIISLKSRISRKILIGFILLTVIWPLTFMAIYDRNHSRVLASSWIYGNIPQGKTIAVEIWDDGLPVSLSEFDYSQKYNYQSLPIYDPDSPEKWQKIAAMLEKTDYIALTSNRLWGSITKVPELYPIASGYYRLLFSGKLGFKKVAETTSFPDLPLPLGNTCLYLFPPGESYLGLYSDKSGFFRFDSCALYQGVTYEGIVIRDELSEETFTVYDHPKVILFEKEKPVDYVKLLYNGNH